MFLTLVKCNTCPGKEFQRDYEIKDKYSYSYTLTCSHFDVPISFYFKNEKFERYLIGFKCNNCQYEKMFKFKDAFKKGTYCCENCKCGSTFYMYEISDNKDRNIMEKINNNKNGNIMDEINDNKVNKLDNKDRNIMEEINDNKDGNIMDEINDNKDKKLIYKTPNKDPNKEKSENEEKINIMLFYGGKKYNHVVDANKSINDYYNEIKEKIKFPDGKKFYKNYNELNLYKSFKENKVNNGMQLEIGN